MSSSPAQNLLVTPLQCFRDKDKGFFLIIVFNQGGFGKITDFSDLFALLHKVIVSCPMELDGLHCNFDLSDKLTCKRQLVKAAASHIN